MSLINRRSLMLAGQFRWISAATRLIGSLPEFKPAQGADMSLRDPQSLSPLKPRCGPQELRPAHENRNALRRLY
ncbi:hypothetical protein [Tardiphaga robiniae]|uniref:hypothetical protein n=1 Tax=Tardiphaga robiniae TaxID=943830 RepID=UPI001111BB09|nr:hypothetical protein [Tardiphaga robiniae]